MGWFFLSRRSTWLYRGPVDAPGAAVATDNPTAAYLMPLLAILAAGVVSHAMSGHFETFYPIRLIAGAAMLWAYRRRLVAIDWHWSWRGLGVGVFVFLIWILAARFLAPTESMPIQLAALSPGARGVWITAHVIASVLTVPIAEELAYRGYLMRRLSNADFESVAYPSLGWPALVAAAIVFGLAHGSLWLPGIAAGLAYGLLTMRRGTLGEAVAAHATTNALIALTVVGGAQWQLW